MFTFVNIFMSVKNDETLELSVDTLNIWPNVLRSYPLLDAFTSNAIDKCHDSPITSSNVNLGDTPYWIACTTAINRSYSEGGISIYCCNNSAVNNSVCFNCPNIYSDSTNWPGHPIPISSVTGIAKQLYNYIYACAYTQCTKGTNYWIDLT